MVQPIFSKTKKPIFDMQGASSMTKANAPQNMQLTLARLQRLQDVFYQKHKKVLVINDAIAKAGTSRETDTPGSQHFHGNALDISINGLSAEQQDDLAMMALQVGFKGLGFGRSILHVDTRQSNGAWDYGNSTFGTKSTKGSDGWIEIAKKYNHTDQFNIQDTTKKESDKLISQGSGKFDRGRFADQLKGDPRLYEDLVGLAYGEVGGDYNATVAFIETIFNRTNAYGIQDLRSSIYPKNVSKSKNYYDVIRKGTLDSKKKFIYSDSGTRYKKIIEKAINDALNGSNISNFATHNSSGSVAAEAKRIDHVRSTFNGETFSTKTNDNPEARKKHKGLIDKEIAWMESVGGVAGNADLSKAGDPGTQPTSFQQSFSSGQGVGGFLGGLLGSGLGSGAISTGNIASAISGALPPALASLPSASTFSTGLARSIQTGQGFTPFTSAVQSIASAETPVGRLSAIGDVATQYEAEIKALVPSLSDMDFKSIIPAIVGLEDQSPNQRLISALKMMETTDPDKLITVSDVLEGDALEKIKQAFEGVENLESQPLSTIFDDSKMDIKEKIGLTTLGTFSNLDGAIENNKMDVIYAKAMFGNSAEQAKALEFLTKGNLPDIEGLEESFPTLLSGSLEEIVKTPLVTSQLGEQYAGIASTVLTGEASVVEKTLTDLGASAISKATGISGDTSQTLLAGGTDDEVKRMRSEIGGMALDKYIETNPTLKSIIQWFTENQDLITLLGTAGAFAGLSSLLGGGMFGGLAAGAGGMVAARMILGKEGYGNLMSTVETAAAPAFDLLNGIVDATGLGDIPVMGDMLRGVLGVGRGNPLAALSMATGNFAGAAGILAGSTGVSLFDGEVSSAAMIESLMNSFGMGYSQTTQSTSNNSAENKPNQTTGLPKQGAEGNNPNGQPMTNLYFPYINNYREYGPTGPSNIVGPRS